MSKSRDCKIVQDLLPNYIENLTDIETNQYIEKHIMNCKLCQEKLRDMEGNIKLDKINEVKKIDALKKVKRKYKLITAVITIIIFLILLGTFYFRNNYTFVNENNKLMIRRVTFDKNNYSDETYLIIKGNRKEGGTKNGYAYITAIISINSENKCINMRKIIDGYTTEQIEILKNETNRTNNDGIISNLKVENEIIYYNDSSFNNKTKNEILELFKTIMTIDSVTNL